MDELISQTPHTPQRPHSKALTRDQRLQVRTLYDVGFGYAKNRSSIEHLTAPGSICMESSSYTSIQMFWC